MGCIEGAYKGVVVLALLDLLEFEFLTTREMGMRTRMRIFCVLVTGVRGPADGARALSN